VNTPITDRLRACLAAKLGNDWREYIPLRLRADMLSWIVYLAEVGIAAKRKEWTEGKKSLDASELASLGSWTMDLESLVTLVEASTPIALPPKKGKKNHR